MAPYAEEEKEDNVSVNTGLDDTCAESGARDRDESLAMSSSLLDNALEASHDSTGTRLSSRRSSLGESLNNGSNTNADRLPTGNSSGTLLSNSVVQDQHMTASVQHVDSVLASSLSGSGVSRSTALQDDWQSNQSRRSSLSLEHSGALIDATLVEENDPVEFVVAQPEGFFHRHGKIIA
eukprot:CCRYP_005903-RA/>CCRYP_005903-RA protein AED:0.70 eAED:0.70 QI:0/0/0/0.5/1/1/2/0/178